MNKKILITCIVVFVVLLIATFQYVKEFQLEYAGATAVKPPNGHLWSEMACDTSGICITGAGVTEKLEVATGLVANDTTERIRVNGKIKATDICTSAGNCLSQLATLSNSCGGAQRTYLNTETTYSGVFCLMGTPTPAAPVFPQVGVPTNWTCPVTNGSPVSCTATRLPPVVYLENGLHTEYECTLAGGEVVASDVTLKICRFGTVASPVSSCPTSGNWHWYKGYSTVASCRMCWGTSGCHGNGGCSDYGGHAWANDAGGSGVYSRTDRDYNGEECAWYTYYCTASRIQMGCY